ncbi:MAG: hypothetical protein ACRDSR_27565, partial [Pseudonocardiaceae bacterium]
ATSELPGRLRTALMSHSATPERVAVTVFRSKQTSRCWIRVGFDFDDRIRVVTGKVPTTGWQATQTAYRSAPFQVPQ